MKATVTALLVSHDGARWLPAVLDGLEGQSRRPDRVVAVDTGSSDNGPDLLRERLGVECVHSAPPRTSYGEAVATGLRTLPPADESEWVWLLHDDSAPAPRALEVLLDAAAANPSVDVLGPKLREWPSLRRLLEVGVTISGTGRRETGLERGEYDQGQHDQIHEVLAVNTAGMLVRRDAARAARLRPAAADVRQRPRLRLARRTGRPPDPGGAGRGGLPRRGGAPRRPPHRAHRQALPPGGAPGRALHAARQRLRERAAVPGGAAAARQHGPRARLPAGAVPGRGVRRDRRGRPGLQPPDPDRLRTSSPAGPPRS